MRFSRLVLSSVLGLCLSSCQPTQDIRGNLIKYDDIARLKPFQQTQEDVLEILGPPFEQQDKTRWLYIGQEQETQAFLLPQVKRQCVVLVTFDSAGRYLRIEEISIKRNDVDPDPDTSSVDGQDLTIVGQTLDNLRRSSRNKKGKRRR
jgi:outer membrane protein assembly factor BamE (lipoprotein component of BamABCDE complex)